ncbi:MAG: GNAT family N-acetyltransferase [Bradyrhizobium sp.]|nr:GNAT family N-acetyltransferase [Bradyrhizobium sp.]
MTIDIVRLTPDNAALLARVADDVFDDEIVPQRLAAFLAEAGHLMLIAVDEDLVVGQVAAVVHRHPDQLTELYVDNLGVTPSHRRQGIGRRLIEEMLALGRKLGCEECWVGTEVDNQPARGLYSRHAKAGIFALYEFDL